jgi:hypothetical protein
MNENINEKKMIAFCTRIFPTVSAIFTDFFDSHGIKHKLVMNDTDGPTYHLTHNNGTSEFYLRNLLLEITTMDRDQIPLVFDERVDTNPLYCSMKINEVCSGRLRVMEEVLNGADLESIKNTFKDDKRYRRFQASDKDEDIKSPDEWNKQFNPNNK